MQKIVDYKVACAENAADLSDDVMELIDDGYTPSGGASISVVWKDEKWYVNLTQAMVKHEDEEKITAKVDMPRYITVSPLCPNCTAPPVKRQHITGESMLQCPGCNQILQIGGC